MNTKLLFENDNYRVLRTDCDVETKSTIVSFDSWQHNRSPEEPRDYAEITSQNFVTRKGMNAIFVQTRRNDWYQGAGIMDALASVVKSRRAGEVFVTYGASMGGHASASFSAELEADFFISFSAQVSLSTEFMGEINDRRWHDSHPAFRYDNVLNGQCQSQKGLVCFDNMQPLDRIHAERMLRKTNSFAIDCPGTWHFAISLLQREFGVMNLVKEIAQTLHDDGDVGGYLAVVREKVSASFAARFMRASGLEKSYIAKDHGIEKILKEIHPHALLAAFELDPNFETARLLCDVKPFIPELPRRNHIDRVLVRKGYGDIV